MVMEWYFPQRKEGSTAYNGSNSCSKRTVKIIYKKVVIHRGRSTHCPNATEDDITMKSRCVSTEFPSEHNYNGTCLQRTHLYPSVPTWQVSPHRRDRHAGVEGSELHCRNVPRHLLLFKTCIGCTIRISL